MNESISNNSKKAAGKTPVLIIDKKGEIGELLAESLLNDFLPVLVSGKKPDKEFAKSVVYISLRKKIPKIPENHFSQLFYIDSEESHVRGLIKPLRAYAKKHAATLNILTSIYFKKISAIEEVVGEKTVKLFVAGDIFGGKYTYLSVFGKLILTARAGSLTLSDRGLLELYPVSMYEAAGILLKNVSLANTEQNVFLLYPKHPITGLSASRHLLKYFPGANLNLLNKKQNKHIAWLPGGGVFLPQRSLDEQLREVLAKKPSEIEGSVVSEKQVKPLFPVFASIGFFIVLFFLLPLLSLLTLGYAGSVMTKMAIGSLEKGDLRSAQVMSEQAKNSFELSGKIAGSFMPVAGVFGKGKSLESYTEKMASAQKVNDILLDLSFALDTFKKSQSERDRERSKSLFISSLNRLTQGLLTLRTLEAEGDIPQDYAKKLMPYKQAGNYFLAVKDTLPAVLGYDREKVYLILFQNNNELRPGGGFIGSYGLMKVNKGAVSSVEIYDVYDADGQLTAHVEPPIPLNRYMGVENWYLRDSNFAADFTENAARAAFFLKLETNDMVDGVIALDTTFISSILKATGPIEIADFDKTVTADNFSESVQSEIEDEFFPGSQKKKQLLSAFYDTLFAKLTDRKNLPTTRLLESVLFSISEKHLLIALAKSNEQQPFTLANLSGSLWDGREEEENTINDFLAVVEANLGENKVNPYVQRQISQEVALTETGALTSRVSVTYKNTSSDDQRFGGVYKNYLRFLTPFSLEPTKLVIDGKERVMLASLATEADEDARGRVATNTISVDRGEEKGRKTLGFLIEVPAGKTLKVELEFQRQTGFTRLDPEVNYSLKLFKQPGRLADPYSFNFSLPEGYQVISKSNNVAAKPDEVTAFFLLKEDVEIEIGLGKK